MKTQKDLQNETTNVQDLQPVTPISRNGDNIADGSQADNAGTHGPDTHLLLWQIIVCLIGVLSYASSFFPLFAESSYASPLLKQIGVGVLVFGVTSFTMIRLDRRYRIRQLETVGQKVEDVTTRTFELVRSAQDSGITKIYPLRVGDNSRTFKARLAYEFEKAATEAVATNKPQLIRMMGISLRDFFFQNGDLHSVADSALRNSHLQFQILLIDPFSEQAVLRSERESQLSEGEEYAQSTDHYASTLFADIQNCTRYLARFTADRIETRFYHTAPSCFLVFVNDRVFVETYHYGRTGVGGLAGGRVPVLEFHSQTETYLELQGNFDYVWFKSEDRRLDPKLADLIRDHRSHKGHDQFAKGGFAV